MYFIDNCPYKENKCSCGSKQGGWSEEDAEEEAKKHLELNNTL